MAPLCVLTVVLLSSDLQTTSSRGSSASYQFLVRIAVASGATSRLERQAHLAKLKKKRGMLVILRRARRKQADGKESEDEQRSRQPCIFFILRIKYNSSIFDKLCVGNCFMPGLDSVARVDSEMSEPIEHIDPTLEASMSLAGGALQEIRFFFLD